jgi:hypothetical protein
MADLLSPNNVAKVIAESLPRSASPQLANEYQAIAIAVHATLTAVGFRLVGLGEDHRIGWHLSFAYNSSE